MAIIWKWSLNGNTNDSAGSNNGTPTALSYVAWKSGEAGSFNGSNSQINANISTWLWWSFTVNCWVKFNTTWTHQAIIEVYVPSYNNYWFSIVKTNTNLISVNLFNWTQNPNKNSWTTTVTSWIWYMVTLVRNTIADTLEWFLNWVSFWSVNDTTTSVPTYSKINIWYWQNPNIYLNGSMDEVEIHNTALTPAQIKNKYLYYNWFI